MSNYTRMDGVASRVPSDIERKYNFGKSFAEIMGIAKDAQTHAVEAERIVKQIQAQGLEIDVVEALNVSAGTIELKSNGLVIQSKDFSLSDEKGIVAKKGNIGKWDISESGISKATTNYFVKIASPDSDDEDVITVSKIENGLVTAVPFCLKANGSFFSNTGEIAGFNVTENGLEYLKSDEPDEYGLYTVDRLEYTTDHILCETKFMEGNIPTRIQSTKIVSSGLFFTLNGSEVPASTEISFAILEKSGTRYTVYADLNDMTVKVR